MGGKCKQAAVYHGDDGLRIFSNEDVIIADTLILGSGNANGTVSVRGKDGQPLIELLARDDEAVIGVGQKGRPGRLTMYNATQHQSVDLNAKTGRLQLGGGGLDGAVSVLGADGEPLVELLGKPDECVIGLGQSKRPGRISIYDDAGRGTVEINGKVGDITLFNADCAEEFDLAGLREPPKAGYVVILDEQGCLRPAQSPYDPRVAGVISGAGDCRPALVLDRREQSQAVDPSRCSERFLAGPTLRPNQYARAIS